MTWARVFLRLGLQTRWPSLADFLQSLMVDGDPVLLEWRNCLILGIREALRRVAEAGGKTALSPVQERDATWEAVLIARGGEHLFPLDLSNPSSLLGADGRLSRIRSSSSIFSSCLLCADGREAGGHPLDIARFVGPLDAIAPRRFRSAIRIVPGEEPICATTCVMLSPCP